MNEALSEALYVFMTTLVATELSQQRESTTLSGGNDMYTHPGCQYTISMLDLSANQMIELSLAIVVRIVQKKSVYQFEDLRLNNIISASETPSEFLDTIRAAFDLHKLLQLSNNASSARMLAANNI